LPKDAEISKRILPKKRKHFVVGKAKLALIEKPPEELKTDQEKAARKQALKLLKLKKKQDIKDNSKAASLKKQADAVKQLNEVLKDGKPSIVTQDILDTVPAAVREYVESHDIIFKPNAGPQTDFLAANETEVFFGGARGGGKSYGMLADALRECTKQAHRALILRRTMPELRDLIAKSHMLYPRAFPGAKWREQDKEYRFPSGARIEFGYAENMQDALRYQGQSYTWIGVDELPQWPSIDIWNFLRSSLRSTDPNIKAVMRATGNPGNIGSAWVKQTFIDPAPANTRFEITVEAVTPRGAIKETISRRYIPSTVFDNPYLTYDNAYIAMLASLPEIQRRQFLEGDWDAFDKAAFSDFKREVHVVNPFPIPNSWMRFRACDWGYSSPACVLWFAVTPDNELIVYRELYTKGLTADVFARVVLDMEMGEQIRYGVLDASAWAQRGDVGPSIAETMTKEGCRWRPSDRSGKSRHNGKMEIHRRLKVHPITTRPGLVMFSTCTNLIRTLPMLPMDDNDPEDINTDAEDHAYDALRYGATSRPVNVGMMFDNTNPTRPHAYTPVDNVFGY
jgi:Terminase large subunit, T4likevirus-type, N-terminal